MEVKKMNKFNEIDKVITHIIDGNNKSNIIPLISFSEPLFFLTIQLNDIFFCYVLQNRALTDGNSRADIKEVYISKTTFDIALEVLENKISIYDALNTSVEKYRIGQIGRKVFPKKRVYNIEEIADRIPREKYFLEINNESTRYAKNIIKNKKNIFEKYGLFEKLININDQKNSQVTLRNIRKINDEIAERDYTFVDGVIK